MLNVFHYSLDILKSKLGASISMKYRGAFIHTNWVALRKYPSGGGGVFMEEVFMEGMCFHIQIAFHLDQSQFAFERSHSHSDLFSLRSISVHI